MNTILLIFVALLTLTVSNRIPENYILKNRLTALELKDTNAAKKNEIAIQGRSLSSSGKTSVENFINQLPCGWPEAGIPPLAPYTKKEILLEFKNSFAEIFAKLENFRIDGLDIVFINRLKINYTFQQKVIFNFVWPKIVIRGKFITDSLIDFMKQYGISVQYEGKADIELILEDIIFQGHFKYKVPLLFGSNKIYKFDGSISLGNVISRIDGPMGNGKYNRLLNEQIEDILMKVVSSNQDKISAKLENHLVPYLNEKIKGRKIWSVIGSVFGKKGKICYPPADPWN